MTPRSALLLLLALAPLAAAFPLDDYAAETDSYALARDAAAGEDYFPALSEPAEGEYEYERPPAPLPAIVYFAEAPALAQAPAGPRPLGPSKLANKVSEGPVAPGRALPPPPARLVPALVLLLPNRDAVEPARFQQLPSAAQDELPPQPWPYLQAPASRGPAPPFLLDAPADQEVPVPDTEVRPPPMPEAAAAPAAESETDSDESDESDESKDATSPKSSSEEDDSETTPAPPSSTLSPPRTRRSPGGGSSASSNSKSSASSSSGGAGASSFSSASSHSSASSGFGEPIFFGGPTNGDSYASSSSQSNAQAGGAGDAAGYGPGFGAGAPSFGAPGAGGYGNYGAGTGAGYNPHGGAGAGYGGQGGQGGHAGPAYGGDGNLLNRFGSLDEPAPSSVQHSGTSSGKGVHSSSSSSIDSTGKVTYHVQAGKF